MDVLKAFIRWLELEELIDCRIKMKIPKLPQELFPILSDEEISCVRQSVEVTIDREQSQPGSSTGSLITVSLSDV